MLICLMESQPNNNRIYKKFERKKIEIIKYEEQYSIHKASEKYDENRQNIRISKNQLPNLISA